DKLENCLVAAKTAPLPLTPSRPNYLMTAALVVLASGAAVVGVELWHQRTQPAPIVASPTPVVPPQKTTFARPEWILSDVPSSAYCHDMINRLMCVGVSGYRSDRDDAVAEATDAALDELVNAVGLRIAEPMFRETIMPAYSESRMKALTALQTAD